MKFRGLPNKDLNHTSSSMKEFNGTIHINKITFVQLVSSLMWPFDSRNYPYITKYLQTKMSTSMLLALKFRTAHTLLNLVV